MKRRFFAPNLLRMNTIRFLLLCLALSGAACQQKSDDNHHHSHAETEDSPNKALYDEVMGIHDEVMPKMDDLYKAKTVLKKRLAATPPPSDDEIKAIKEKIGRIDAASEGMMVWMRQFNPVADSAGEEKAKAYLEAELIKVKKVKEDILLALESAK
jgi:hypothetical protein